MAIVDDYFASLSRELQQQSARVRQAFKSHRPTVGDNRESIVAQFIERHLPARFGVTTGIIISRGGAVSNQADVVIFDRLLNTPLQGDLPEKAILVESVYALLEIKSKLSPSELQDAIDKCRRFKALQRDFLGGPSTPSILDSLFVLWAFEAAKPTVVKESFLKAVQSVPAEERPDFLIVPGLLVASSGSYLELSVRGQPGSLHRAQMEASPGSLPDATQSQGLRLYALGDHSLLAFLVWLTSWLQFAGPRTAPLASYLPPNTVFGRSV